MDSLIENWPQMNITLVIIKADDEDFGEVWLGL